MGNYKDYWAYQEVKKNYNVTVDKSGVEIRWKEDNEVCAKFIIEKFEDMYLVKDTYGSILNDEMDYTTTYDDCVCSCFYYFYSRY